MRSCRGASILEEVQREGERDPHRKYSESEDCVCAGEREREDRSKRRGGSGWQEPVCPSKAPPYSDRGVQTNANERQETGHDKTRELRSALVDQATYTIARGRHDGREGGRARERETIGPVNLTATGWHGSNQRDGDRRPVMV